MRASSCLFSPCHAHITAAAFLHSCRIGLQTRHHLSSSQTPRHQKRRAKNCVAPLMKTTDAHPLVSTPPCLHSAVTPLFSAPPSLIWMRMKRFVFFSSSSSLQITQRAALKLARVFSCPVSYEAREPLDFMNK